MIKHSFTDFFDPAVGLAVKSAGNMEGGGCQCPASWSPAGMPAGVFEALECSCNDLIDWPAGARDGYVTANNNASTVANSYIALAASRMSEVAQWLNKTKDARRFGQIAATIQATMRNTLYSKTTGAFIDGLGIEHSSMHATLFATMAGAVDETAEPGMGLAVVRTLQAKGMNCSCMAAYWLLEGLYRIGWHTQEAADLALDILTSAGPNSWLNMIKQRATATIEAWTPAEKPNASWSHPWCAGPNSVLVRLLLGVQPIALGWKRMLFAPQPSTLSSVSAVVATSRGGVPVTISQSNMVQASINVPEGVSCRVCLPAPVGVEAPHLVVDSEVVAAQREGRMLCAETDLSPGAHVVQRKA